MVNVLNQIPALPPGYVWTRFERTDPWEAETAALSGFSGHPKNGDTIIFLGEPCILELVNKDILSVHFPQIQWSNDDQFWDSYIGCGQGFEILLLDMNPNLILNTGYSFFLTSKVGGSTKITIEKSNVRQLLPAIVEVLDQVSKLTPG